MLAKQSFYLSLAGGISTKDDSKQVIPGKLLVLENGIFTSPKEIRKRNGYQALNQNIQNNFTFTSFDTVPLSMNNGNFLTDFSKELVLNDSSNLYSYSDGLAQWIYKAPNTVCSLSVIPIVRNTNSQTLADSAIDPLGIQIFAWEESSDGNVHVSIMDTQTNQIIIADKVISPIGGGHTIKPKCAYLNGQLIVFYLDNSTNMHLSLLAYSGGMFQSPILVSTIVNISHNNYDVVISDTFLYVAYNTDANSVKVLYFNGLLVESSAFTEPGTNANNCITVFPDPTGNIWVAYADSTTAKVFIVNHLLDTELLAPTTFVTLSNIYNITGLGDSGFATIFYDIKGSADNEGAFSNAITSYSTVQFTGSTSAQILFLRSAALQSKAFGILENGLNVPYVFVTHDSLLQATYFLTNLANVQAGSLPKANIVSKIAAGLGGGLPAKPSSLSAVNLASSNVFQTAMLQKDLLFTSASTIGTVNTYTQTGVISVLEDFTKTNPDTLTLGGNLHIGTGMLAMYDGATVVEHNFHVFPEAFTAVVNTSGGHLTDSASYGYQITYEWTDNNGQLHRSAPSPVLSEVTTATGSNVSQVVLTIPTLRLTAKINVNIVIYRTQANGSVYFRLNLPTAPLLNSTTVDTVTYTDNAADSTIGANEQLYTTGGEVPNSGAPASVIFGEYKNRIILIPSDNPYSWWFSKQVIPGSPVEFSDVFVENIGTEGGPITAFIQMDSNAIFFKENSIFYVVGDGPAPSGANNDFTQALSVSSDVGCINAQSLILMPGGIIFKSNKGIYLLSRGMALEYIGSEVEAFNNDVVTSAKLISYTNQIRFTLNSGVTLVYDYFVSQWSVFTNINAVSSTVTAQDTFTYLKSNGLALQETVGQFSDNGSFIKLRIVTSWLSLAGIQGFQRIYKALILGQYFGPHKLQVQFAYDFNPITTQSTYIDAARALNSNIYGSDPLYGINSSYGGQYPTYQWRVFTDRQVCEAIQITIEDIAVVGNFTNNQGLVSQVDYNQSLSLSAISLELGMKKGLNKMPGNRSF